MRKRPGSIAGYGKYVISLVDNGGFSAIGRVHVRLISASGNPGLDGCETD